ncbi:MAG TPA: hypothetical protein VFG69_21135, partial [Nannocystaceae bacterium]|nr:hypothetical protein [Nannocystaceae bacterium]
MAPPRSRAASTILAAVIAHAACQRPADEGTTTATSSSTSSPTLPEPPKFDRVVAPTMPAFGAQPGWIEGGVAFAAIRAQPSIAFLRSLPLPADVARDVAEAGVELGVDLRAEDLERRFALAPDA